MAKKSRAVTNYKKKLRRRTATVTAVMLAGFGGFWLAKRKQNSQSGNVIITSSEFSLKIFKGADQPTTVNIGDNIVVVWSTTNESADRAILDLNIQGQPHPQGFPLAVSTNQEQDFTLEAGDVGPLPAKLTFRVDFYNGGTLMGYAQKTIVVQA